jgi:hypothetical protein
LRTPRPVTPTLHQWRTPSIVQSPQPILVQIQSPIGFVLDGIRPITTQNTQAQSSLVAQQAPKGIQIRPQLGWRRIVHFALGSVRGTTTIDSSTTLWLANGTFTTCPRPIGGARIPSRRRPRWSVRGQNRKFIERRRLCDVGPGSFVNRRRVGDVDTTGTCPSCFWE